MEKGYSIVANESELKFTFCGYVDERSFRLDFNKSIKSSGFKGGSISVLITLEEEAVLELETVKLITSSKFSISRVQVNSGFNISLKSNKLLITALSKVSDYVVIGLINSPEPIDLDALEIGLLDKLDNGSDSSTIILDKDSEPLFEHIDFTGLGIDLDRFIYQSKDVTELVTEPIYSVRYKSIDKLGSKIRTPTKALAYIGSEKQIYFVLSSLARFHHYRLKYNVEVFMRIIDTMMSEEVLSNEQGYQGSVVVGGYEVGYVITKNKEGSQIALIIRIDKNKSNGVTDNNQHTSLQTSSLFK